MIWRRRAVAWVDSGPRVVVVRLAEQLDAARVLDGPAAIVWRAIGDDGASLGDLVETIASEVEAEPEEIAADVETFLEQLRDLELVEIEVTA